MTAFHMPLSAAATGHGSMLTQPSNVLWKVMLSPLTSTIPLLLPTKWVNK